MHPSSYEFMNDLFKLFSLNKLKGDVLDIGSQMVQNQQMTYKTIFEETDWNYKGLDIEKGINVDILAENPYKFPVEDDSYDLIISGQAFEHIEFVWLTIKEIARVLKPGGIFFLVAPARGKEHKFPVDCWRFYPDGYAALAKWSNLKLLGSFADWAKVHDIWGFADCVGAFLKPNNNGENLISEDLIESCSQRLQEINAEKRQEHVDNFNAKFKQGNPAKK